MEPERRCAQCGQTIPEGQEVCPQCSKSEGSLWWIRREAFLLLMFLGLIVFFVVTGFAAKYYHAEQKSLAEEWYARGEAHLRTHEPDQALQDFRNALAYSKENSLYRLRLAQALVEVGRAHEARTYLLSLWERQPGNGTINLELARLAAKDHNISEATRYYHNAIYGEWDEDPGGKRRTARLELAEFLLGVGAKTEADSELIALAGDLPPAPQVQTQVGKLLMQVNEDEQALKLFRDALAEDSNYEAALLGAGEVNFNLGRYPQAQGYLEHALRKNPQLPHAASMLETARAVLSIDPFERRLSNSERARRASQAFEQAKERLEGCAAGRGVSLKEINDNVAPNELQSLYQRVLKAEPQVRERSLRRDPDLVSSAMDLVFEVERTTARECGQPQGLDKALLLVARAQEGHRP
jgi:predicted Zn-dependent protease/predicted nucleic acid-binding Zn ribbon protein